MGCFLRVLLGTVLFAAAGLFLIGFLMGWAWTADQLNAAETALATPVKSLDEALRQDGPAWVKVRLEPATGAVPLICAGQECLWVEEQRLEAKVEDLRRGGVWTKAWAMRQVKMNRQGIPMDLVDGARRVTITDWVGVEAAPDLLQQRMDEASETVEMTAEAVPFFASGPLSASGPVALGPGSGALEPLVPQGSPGQVIVPGAATASGPLPIWTIRQRFLLTGTEAWVLGRFEGGVPKVFVEGKFILTGLGRERYARFIDSGTAWVGKARWYCGLGALLCAFLGGVVLLKRRS